MLTYKHFYLVLFRSESGERREKKQHEGQSEERPGNERINTEGKEGKGENVQLLILS